MTEPPPEAAVTAAESVVSEPSAGAGNEAEIAEARMVTRHVACSTCAYDLRGLPEAGRCPECGHAVMHSITRTLPAGWSAVNVRQISRGLMLLSVVLPLLLLIPASLFVFPLFIGALSVLTAGSVWGVWQVTASPGAGADQMWWLRHLCRTAALLAGTLALGALAFYIWYPQVAYGFDRDVVAAAALAGSAALAAIVTLLLVVRLSWLGRALTVPVGPRLMRLSLLTVALPMVPFLAFASEGLLLFPTIAVVLAGAIWWVWSFIYALDWLRGEIRSRLRAGAG